MDAGKYQRELLKKDEEILRLQQEVTYHLHQNETLRKRVDEEEKAELKVNRILLENFAIVKKELLALKENIDQNEKEVEQLRDENNTLKEDHLDTLSLLETICANFRKELAELNHLELSDLKLNLETKQQQITEQFKAIDSFEAQIKNCSHLLKDLESEICTLQEQKEKLSEENNGLEKKIIQIQESAMEKESSLHSQLDILHESSRKKDDCIAELQLQVKALETLIQRTQNANDELIEEMLEIKHKHEILSEKCLQLESVTQEKSEALKDLNAEKEEWCLQKQHYEVLRSERDSHLKIIAAYKEEQQAVESVLRIILGNIPQPTSGKHDEESCCIDQNFSSLKLIELLKLVTNHIKHLEETNQKLRDDVDTAKNVKASLQDLTEDLQTKCSLLTEKRFGQKAGKGVSQPDCKDICHVECCTDFPAGDLGECEKENVTPQRHSTKGTKDPSSEMPFHPSRGRVKTLQEKFLAMTMASQSPLKESVLKETSSRKKVWDENERKRLPSLGSSLK